MLELPGYTVVEELPWEATGVVSYRVRDERSGEPLVVTVPRSEYPSDGELARLRHEHQIGTLLTANGIVRSRRLERYRNGLALVTEDVDCESLAHLIATRRLDLRAALEIALSVAATLGQLHDQGVLHKNVNPSTVFVRLQTGEVKLGGFGFASSLASERQTAASPTTIEGALPYISPEQTGRMNRAIDYRSDFYSLGVTLYEMLTGEQPFRASDPLELVHSHIARVPPSPSDVDPTVPAAVSAIVARLLAKTAEERYQSAAGLCADLGECLSQLRATGAIESFTLGRDDVTDRLRLPQRLYGRDEEIAALRAALERAADGESELVLVYGPAGIGKSALVNEVHRSIAARRGYFIAGKFDQRRRDTPYGSIIQAFQELVRQLLSEGPESLARWRALLDEALDGSGAVVVDVIPEMTSIIGAQPDLPVLPPAEAEARFGRVFAGLVGVFARREHPLVLFLDDLQWADPASIRFLEKLLGPATDSRHLLVIGACRDNEVSPDHPLPQAIASIRRAGHPCGELRLRSLDVAECTTYLADALHTERGRVALLGELVHGKTDGNPFFVGRFLLSLRDAGLLAFDRARERWDWDLEAIRRVGITENVVELMVAVMRELPPSTRHLLELAACIGNLFDLRTLAVIAGQPGMLVARDLWPALSAGLVLPADEHYKYVHALVDSVADLDSILAPERTVQYRFAHDRVQQAAYSMIDEEERSAVHARIGRLLIASLGDESLDERIFEIVDHLNAGARHVSTERERLECARLNLDAGRRARNSAAYHAGAVYFDAALAMLGDGSWREHYELTRDAVMGRGECAYLDGEFAEAERFFDDVLENAREVVDRGRVYAIKVQLATHSSQPDRALELGLEGLRALGVPIARTASKAAVARELIGVRWLLRGRRPTDLDALPRMTDPIAAAALELLNNITIAAYYASEELFGVVVLKMMALTLRHGTAEASPYAFGVYGNLVGFALRNHDLGRDLGLLAVRLTERYPGSFLRGRARYVAIAVVHYRDHLRRTLEAYREAARICAECGDTLYQFVTRYFEFTTKVIVGMPLATLEQETAESVDIARTLRYDVEGFEQAVAFVRQMRHADESLDIAQRLDAPDLLERLASSRNVANVMAHRIWRVMLHVHRREHAEAAALADESEQYVNGVFSQVLWPQYYFFWSVAIAGSFDMAPNGERRRLLRRLRRNQALLKPWADGSPENYRSPYQLVEAERARLAGRWEEASRLFDEAIDGALESGFVNVAALANERASWYHQGRGDFARSTERSSEAIRLYREWGASEIIRRLTSASTRGGDGGAGEGGGAGDALDLASVLKASQALSTEIVLGRLLTTLLRIVLENAGADRGVLLLESDGELRVEASGRSADDITVLQSIPLEASADIPHAVVYYVEHTRSSLVLDDAAGDRAFGGDRYIESVRPKSVLCLPILTQARLVGILYLENSLVAGAFTPERVGLLGMLSTQMAGAIVNARLYSDLARLNTAYERFVPREFLELLSKKSIVDLGLGDQRQREMTVLFSDIRGFTAMSEAMSPKENFDFINSYLRRMGPIIRANGGFIDKYIGDAIMALFPRRADDAIASAVEMRRELARFNGERERDGLPSIDIGIGIHTGMLMLGMVGESERLDGTVISDAVNLTWRVESLTKVYRTPTILTERALLRAEDAQRFASRCLGRVVVRGKSEPVTIYELLDAAAPAVLEARLRTRDRFEEGVRLFHRGDLPAAAALFEDALEDDPTDDAARHYLASCNGQGGVTPES